LTVAEIPVFEDEELAEATPAELEEIVRLAEIAAQVVWLDEARPEQLPPDWDWFVWLILAGRGWGKTRTGAEWAAEKAREHPGVRIALVAQTFQDGRDTMVEGESGLLRVLERHELRGGDIDGAWNRSLGELFMANGSRFKIFSSEKPRQLRGPQHHFAWGDEPATWLDAQKGPAEDTTWSNLAFGCRLTIEGSSPQVVLTGTPKPVKLLTKKDEEPKGLLHRESTHLTRGHTDENLDNLAEVYKREVVDPVRGTRLGRQELAAEIIEDVEGALWKQAWFEHPTFRRPVPYEGPGQLTWQRIITGADLSDGTETGAKHAYTTSAKGQDHDLYVLESKEVRARPAEFAKEVVRHSAQHNSEIVLEKNHGGEWAVEVFERAMIDMDIRRPLRVVTASKGKKTRAQPIAALYEPREFGPEILPGRVHHLKVFPELEEQQTSWTGASNEDSPDALDSLVWSLWEFTGAHFKPPPSEDEGTVVPYSTGRKRLLNTPYAKGEAPVESTVVGWG
jgi:phage terminase large subunit-like protein